jgi:hypothetical protein
MIWVSRTRGPSYKNERFPKYSTFRRHCEQIHELNFNVAFQLIRNESALQTNKRHLGLDVERNIFKTATLYFWTIIYNSYNFQDLIIGRGSARQGPFL